MQTTKPSESPLSVEVTSSVARLLSRENIQIQRGAFPSAWFDPKGRVLGLPILKTETKGMIDLFVGHEIGHALYTPPDMVDKWKIEVPGASFDVCNILEDIRIEHAVQREYPGLIKCFQQGYKDLWEHEFFGVSEESINELNFLDRLNLKAKMPELDIFFDESEMYYVNEAMSVRTPEDVYRVGRLLKEICESRKNPENDPQSDSQDDPQNDASDANTPNANDTSEEEDGNSPQSNPQSKENEEEGQTGEGSASGVEDDEADSEDEDGQEDAGNAASELDKADEVGDESSASGECASTGKAPDWSDEDLTSETLHNMEENIDKSVELNYEGFNFIEPSKEMIDACVYSYKAVMKMREKKSYAFSKYMTVNKQELDDEYRKFQKESKPFVGALRREFEQKKAAFQWSRATPAQKGVIDVNQLHKYRYEDNIFSAVTQLADTKSHGMVFMLDLSGSMKYTLRKTTQYLLNLTEFCRSVGIPFEVYTFTTSRINSDRIEEERAVPSGTIRLMNTHINQVLSSQMTKKEYETACRDLFFVNYFMSAESSDPTPLEVMGGTPLLESLIVLNHLVRAFQKVNSHQVTNVMILSDGDGTPLDTTYSSFNTPPEKRRRYYGRGPGYGRIAGGRYRRIKFNEYESTYKSLLENIRETCNANILGFYLVTSTRQASRALNNTYIARKRNNSKFIQQFRKENVVSISNAAGYDNYTLFQYINNKEGDAPSFKDVELNENATNTKLAKEFTKFNSSKKANRIFVSKFVETIAGNL